MNKHQLASTIWESANQMRSKIEANEYKDFILGFIFYKYLSERELELFRKEKLSDEEIKKVDETDVQYAKHVRETLGYFIAYGNILSSKSLPAYMAEEIFEYTDDHANIKRLIKGDRVTAEYEYDNIGRKISETNALGQTTKYKYSFRGDLVEVINPDHTNTKNLYSSDLGSIYETNIYCDEKGPVKKETIDDFGRVTSVSEISVLESENTYNNQYNYEDFYEDESEFF